MKGYLRSIIKLVIKATYSIVKYLPGPTVDVLFIETFTDSSKQIRNQLSERQTRVINFRLKSLLPAIYYISHSNVIYVDNINIVIGAVKPQAQVIQYWHATSAVKKFGLPTLATDKEKAIRGKELSNYDLICSNSVFMDNVLCESFGVSQLQIAKVGSNLGHQYFIEQFHEQQLSIDARYIIYVPTFREDEEDNQKSIEFIQNFSSDKYQLLYSLHPKVNAVIDNQHAINVGGEKIRNYLTNASLVISDYSSLLIDGSLCNSHVAMYSYDYDKYRDYPGLYIGQNNFWGYFCQTEQELKSYIEQEEFIAHEVAMIKQQFFTYDDSESISRIAKLARK